MSYAEVSVGKTPPADRSNAKSRDSSGADRADPKEVLCSSTCSKQVQLRSRCTQSTSVDCRANLSSLVYAASSDFGGAPGLQLHTLTTKPTVANHSAPRHLLLCTWKTSFWQSQAARSIWVSTSRCCGTTCSLEATLDFAHHWISRPASYA